MKKLVLIISLFSMAALSYMIIDVAAQEEENPLESVQPDGYDYMQPEEESPASCYNCHREHIYRAIGVNPPTAAPQGTLTLTGKGWLSSSHAASFTRGVNDNTYCAFCHAPTTFNVTATASAAKNLKYGTWHAVSCAACHTTHSIAAQFGTRYTNYKPGHDLEEAESYIPRHPENGKQANKQCLECHGSYHGFSSRIKEAMLKSGSLRCIDCHFAGYQVTSGGTVERYHNAKVAENLPWSCNGRFGALISCHASARKNWVTFVFPKIFGAHTLKANAIHAVPEM
jgi:hypothetical protein